MRENGSLSPNLGCSTVSVLHPTPQNNFQFTRRNSCRTLVRSPQRAQFSKQFILRFAISLLLTSADADVILTFAPSVFSALFNAPILRAALAILILGMIVSLARMWFLTFRDRP